MSFLLLRNKVYVESSHGRFLHITTSAGVDFFSAERKKKTEPIDVQVKQMDRKKTCARLTYYSPGL